MGLFEKKTDDAEKGVTDKILGELRALKIQVTELRAERDAVTDVQALEEERVSLKRELTDLQIEFDREQEKWDREKRDVTHMVGLQKKRGEFETNSASREAKLAVREENLEADKARFEEHVNFMEKRFEEELKATRKMMEKFLDRMPETKQLITVGGNGNSRAKALVEEE